MSASLDDLLTTWQDWSYQDLILRAANTAWQAGNLARAGSPAAGLASEPTVSPLEALAANRELTQLLTAWTWHAVRAAREQGATWDQVAATLGTTADQARADYLHRIEQAETYTPDLTDTRAYRAVLDDPATKAAGDEVLLLPRVGQANPAPHPRPAVPALRRHRRGPRLQHGRCVVTLTSTDIFDRSSIGLAVIRRACDRAGVAGLCPVSLFPSEHMFERMNHG